MNGNRIREETIAITGVTGSLGRQLLAELVERNPLLRVIAIARNPHAAQRDRDLIPLFSKLGERLHWIEADLPGLRLQDADRKLLSRASSLWHLAACTALHRRACPVQIEKVNTRGTRDLLRLLDELSPRPALHYASTAYVAGCREGTVTEQEIDCGQKHRNPYERSKTIAETSVRNWLAGGGRGAIYRPSLLVENEPRVASSNIASVFTQLVARAIAQGESSLTLRLAGDASINLVPCDWTARAMVDLSERAPLDQGLCFHLTADSDTQLSEIMESVSQAFPGIKIHFRPDIQPEELTGASRLLDAVLLDLKGYLEASLSFDRRNTRQILGSRFQEPKLNLAQRAADALALSA